jgi:hypothetical protein
MLMARTGLDCDMSKLTMIKPPSMARISVRAEIVSVSHNPASRNGKLVTIVSHLN